MPSDRFTANSHNTDWIHRWNRLWILWMDCINTIWFLQAGLSRWNYVISCLSP